MPFAGLSDNCVSHWRIWSCTPCCQCSTTKLCRPEQLLLSGRDVCGVRGSVTRIHRRGCGGLLIQGMWAERKSWQGFEADGWGREPGVPALGGGMGRVAVPATAESSLWMAAGDARAPAWCRTARRWRGTGPTGGAIREAGAGRASVPGRRGTGFARARLGGDAR